MTKKSLSDLLKEEASKADTPGEAPAPSVPANDAPAAAEAKAQPVQGRKTVASRPKGGKPTGKATGRTRHAATAPSSPEPPVPSSKTSQDVQPTIQDTQSQDTQSTEAIAALETALAAAQRDKADLEKTIHGLQRDLETQQSRLFELTDSLDQAKAEAQAQTQARQKAEADLAEAKATILKLTTPAPASSAIARQNAVPVRRSGGDIVPRQPYTGPTHPGYVRGVPASPPQTTQPNPMLSDADIGWVD